MDLLESVLVGAVDLINRELVLTEGVDLVALAELDLFDLSLDVVLSYFLGIEAEEGYL